MKNYEQNITNKAKVVFDRHPHSDHPLPYLKMSPFMGLAYILLVLLLFFTFHLCVWRDNILASSNIHLIEAGTIERDYTVVLRMYIE